MKIATSLATGLLLVKLDGHPDTLLPERTCSFCGKHLIQFVATPGAQQKARLPQAKAVCCNTKWKTAFGASIPCPGAIQAKPLLDAITEIARS